jgi:hypothetical protein
MQHTLVEGMSTHTCEVTKIKPRRNPNSLIPKGTAQEIKLQASRAE